jgi:dTDP-glucose 4,6-dehydratase
MRFIVTGGCGSIGASVVSNLIQRGHRVLNIDVRRRASPTPALAAVTGKEGYARLEADITDRGLMRAVFSEYRPERVIHLASARDDAASSLFEANIAGAFSIVEAARHSRARLTDEEQQGFRIVCAAPAANVSADERRPSMRSAASETGAALIESFAGANGIGAVICRAGDIFGPYERPDAPVSRAVRTLLEAQTPPLESPHIVRDWLSAEDFADGLALAALGRSVQARFDFSAGAERTEAEMVAAIAAILDSLAPRSSDPLIDRAPEPADFPGRSFGPLLEPEDAQRELGWKPGGFHEALVRTVRWLLISDAEARGAIAAE